MLSKNDPVFNGKFSIDLQYRAVGSKIPPPRKSSIKYTSSTPIVKENNGISLCMLNPRSPPFVPKNLSSSNPEEYKDFSDVEPLPKIKNSKSSNDIKTMTSNYNPDRKTPKYYNHNYYKKKRKDYNDDYN